MGGCTFFKIAEGVDVNSAFRSARDESGWEDGHSYSGGLGSKSGGFVLMTDRTMSSAEADRFAANLIDEDDRRIRDKWGPAGAIPVSLPTRTIRDVKVPRGNLTDWRNGGDLAVVTAELGRQKLLRRGETVASVVLHRCTTTDRRSSMARPATTFMDGVAAVTVNKPGGPFTRTVEVPVAVDGTVDVSTREIWLPRAVAKVRARDGEVVVGDRVLSQETKVKVSATATKGRSETRYVLVHGSTMTRWEDGHPTQAAARGAAVALASSERPPAEQIDVVALTRRSDGSPLVTVAREITRTQATVAITLAGTPPGAPDAWLFFGWAPS